MKLYWATQLNPNAWVEWYFLYSGSRWAVTEVGKDVPDMALRPVATGYTFFIKEDEVQCLIWTTVFFSAEVNTIHNVMIFYACGYIHVVHLNAGMDIYYVCDMSSLQRMTP